MISLRSYYLMGLLLVCGFWSAAQDIKMEVNISDRKIEFDEEISLEFKVNAMPDSIDKPIYNDFRILSGPNYSSKTQANNGEINSSSTISYRLAPLNSGKFKLKCPIFYVDGEEVSSKPVKVKVGKHNLTQSELMALKFKGFRKQARKDEGTVQITFSEELGYVEVWENGKKKHLKDLSEEEIESLKSLIYNDEK